MCVQSTRICVAEWSAVRSGFLFFFLFSLWPCQARARPAHMRESNEATAINRQNRRQDRVIKIRPFGDPLRRPFPGGPPTHTSFESMGWMLSRTVSYYRCCYSVHTASSSSSSSSSAGGLFCTTRPVPVRVPPVTCCRADSTRRKSRGNHGEEQGSRALARGAQPRILKLIDPPMQAGWVLCVCSRKSMGLPARLVTMHLAPRPQDVHNRQAMNHKQQVDTRIGGCIELVVASP